MLNDLLKHSLHILKHILIPETQHTKSTFIQESRPFRIVGLFLLVTASIELNDESCFSTEKIRDERTKGYLPSELETCAFPIPELKP